MEPTSRIRLGDLNDFHVPHVLFPSSFKGNLSLDFLVWAVQRQSLVLALGYLRRPLCSAHIVILSRRLEQKWTAWLSFSLMRLRICELK